MVFMTSTNGTCATTALNRSGRMLATAPTSRPPALPPWMTSRSRRRVALARPVFGAVDEVREGVHLLHHPALLAPLLAEFAAAADVGHGVDHAAIEQAEAAGREASATARCRTSRRRRAAAARCRRAPALAIDQRDRHLRAVARRRPDALRLVLRRIVAAEHLLPLEQRPLAVSIRSRRPTMA